MITAAVETTSISETTPVHTTETQSHTTETQTTSKKINNDPLIVSSTS